jgi:hypothetical protein
MKLLVSILLALFCTAAALVAQEDEDYIDPTGPSLHGTVKSDVRMHEGPAGATVATLKKGTDVVVVGMSPKGWVRVKTDAETKGWVDRRFLDVPDPANFTPKSFALAAALPSAPCPTTLASCGPNGCAEPDSSHALLNVAKHGPDPLPAGDPQAVTFRIFQQLQDAADNSVGQAAELDEADRESIQDLDVGDDSLGEGKLVSIAGFMVGKAHPNKKESVNCNVTGAASNDFHITIAPSASDTEVDGIVVEMIPQNRPDGWTTEKLAKVTKAKKKVMVVGTLLYDNLHRVNANPQHILNGQPKRFSLWEVHPITAFYVCPKKTCSASDLSQWTKLEDF